MPVNFAHDFFMHPIKKTTVKKPVMGKPTKGNFQKKDAVNGNPFQKNVLTRTPGNVLAWEVSSQESGIKLISFLKSKLDFYSLRELKKGIESQLCQINGRTERFASTVIGSGNFITFCLDQFMQLTSDIVKFDQSRVLFEDEHFIIYNKPAGLLSDSQGIEKIIPSAKLAHRLDKDTTGALILAKTDLAFQEITSLFKSRKVHKEYLALVEGTPMQPRGVIKNYLGKSKCLQGQNIWGEVPNGLYAETAWQCERKGKKTSLIRCFPKTGRTHQIRVHLKKIGLPIVGDSLYNPFSILGATKIFLHAEKLSFIHPMTDKKVHVQAPLPIEFMHADFDY